MGRLINIFLFVLVLLGAFWLYQVKYEAKLTEDKIASVQKDIAKEKEALLLLKAEWSYLNRPERIQRLAERFSKQLELEEMKPYQIGVKEDLPDRTPDSLKVKGEAAKSIDELLGRASVKRTITDN